MRANNGYMGGPVPSHAAVLATPKTFAAADIRTALSDTPRWCIATAAIRLRPEAPAPLAFMRANIREVFRNFQHFLSPPNAIMLSARTLLFDAAGLSLSVIRSRFVRSRATSRFNAKETERRCLLLPTVFSPIPRRNFCHIKLERAAWGQA